MVDGKQLSLYLKKHSNFLNQLNFIGFQGVRVETAPEAGVRVLAEGKNLVLQGIRRQHAGNYTCTAYNLEGEDTSNVVNVRVMCKSYALQSTNTKPISSQILTPKG